MKLLLDTCTLIWLTQAPEKLSSTAQTALDDATNELCLSHASIWEVHLKHFSGKLILPEKPRPWLSRQMALWGIKDQPVDLQSLHLTSELPPLHKDPFDRLLVAQVRTHQLTLVSPDAFFPRYGIPVIW